MTEFQRFLGNRKTGIKSPGGYFGSSRLTREITLNQVSTAKVHRDPNDGKASRLELQNRASSGLVSPEIGSPIQIGLKPSLQQWQPLKVVQPIFGGIKAPDEVFLKTLTSSRGDKKSPREEQKTKTLLRNENSEAGRAAGAKNQIRQRWAANTLRSTHFLNGLTLHNASMDDVKMIGSKAVLNQPESHLKPLSDDMRSVLSLEEKLKHGFLPMFEANS